MRTPEEIIQVAVGDPDITPIPADNSERAPLFLHFTVNLPLPAFRGLPPEWHFAVVNPQAEISGETAKNRVIPQARALVEEMPVHKPLVLISEHPTVHLVDEFTKIERNVFPLDAHDFPRGRPKKAAARLAPFVAACQRKFKTPPAFAALHLLPYTRNRPVQGWRFFGRRRELRTLLHSDENFVIVGARRVGKTSLMQEAARLKEIHGEEVYFVDVQHCKTAGEVVGEIIRAISPQDAARAVGHHQALDESVLSMILRRLAARSERVTLYLDELGNVISRLSGDDWPFLGLLRRHAQKGKLRIVFSCFQEMFLRQAAEFEGAAVNFGTVLRLGFFSAGEVDEFVCGPLEFWSPLRPEERIELLKLINAHVGHHPFLLQHFCHALFDSLTTNSN